MQPALCCGLCLPRGSARSAPTKAKALGDKASGGAGAQLQLPGVGVQAHAAGFDSSAQVAPARESAPGFVSRRLVIWVWTLVFRGWSRTIEPEDIPELAEESKAPHLLERASQLWEEEVQSGKASVVRLLLRLNCRSVAAGMVIAVLHGLMTAAVRPLLLRQVILSVQGEVLALRDVVLLGLVLLLEAVLQLWMKQFLADDICVSTFAVCASLLTKRIPRMAEEKPKDAKEKAPGTPSSTGAKDGGGPVAATTLIGNDIIRTMENNIFLMQLPSSFVQLVAGVIVLLLIIGLPALIGVVVAFTSVFCNGSLSRWTKRYDKAGLQCADQRITLLRQILEGVRFIKLSAWEQSYLAESGSIRVEETVHHRKFRILEMMTATMGRSTPPLACMCTFIVMVLLGEPLEAADIFSALSIFLTLRLPLGVIPAGINLGATMLNSMQRIGQTLQAPELPDQPKPGNDVAACLCNAELRWAGSGSPVLADVSVDVAWGGCLGVIGAVASGKSTLLLGLLGGLQPTRGASARCREATAYIPQKPIIFSGPILDNILMGHALDEERLWAAVGAAQFIRDIELLPHGLDTEVGERGTTLSGGQQTRLNIARALYHDPRLLVADDPLAAVDVHVAAEIFAALHQWQHASSHRALVLSTNQLHLMPKLDHVVYLEGGRVCVQGPPAHVEREAKRQPQLAELLASARVAATCDAVAGPQASPLSTTMVSLEVVTPMRRGSMTSGGSVELVKSSDKLVKAESRQRGAFAASVPLAYLRAMGPWWCTLYGLIVVSAYVLMAANDWWLALWISSTPTGESPELWRGAVYAALTIGHTLGLVLTNVTAGCAGVHASRSLHSACLDRILRAPVSWFDETPSGRIVSRFSNDISQVDLKLPSILDHFCQMVCATAVCAISMTLVVPWMGIFFIIVTPLFIWLDCLVNRTSREVKRLTNNALSPVLTMVQEVSQSRLLLRVMGQEAWFIERLMADLDMYNSFYYASQSLLSFLRCAGNMLGVAATWLSMLFIWAAPSVVAGAPGGPTGVALALTYSFVIPYFISFLSLFGSMLRIFLASLERLLELKSEQVPLEKPWHAPGVDPRPGSWPVKGEICFASATLRYRPELPPAVDQLTMTVAAGERLGICGRTGAGKSSLSVMLLRLVEMESGSILIDGVDVAKIGLHTLRGAVAVVPQDPFLFSGPLSRNLDPVHAHSREALAAALKRVGLDVDLDSEVGNGGSQFSAGERQLVSIARASLSQNRIVVMDEPTSSCDAQTDARLQSVVQAAFAGRTLLCIAHRLNTIIGYDRILVMEAGQAVELGEPARLLADKSSRFAGMVSKMEGSARS